MSRVGARALIDASSVPVGADEAADGQREATKPDQPLVAEPPVHDSAILHGEVQPTSEGTKVL